MWVVIILHSFNKQALTSPWSWLGIFLAKVDSTLALIIPRWHLDFHQSPHKRALAEATSTPFLFYKCKVLLSSALPDHPEIWSLLVLWKPLASLSEGALWFCPWPTPLLDFFQESQPFWGHGPLGGSEKSMITGERVWSYSSQNNVFISTKYVRLKKNPIYWNSYKKIFL